MTGISFFSAHLTGGLTAWCLVRSLSIFVNEVTHNSNGLHIGYPSHYLKLVISKTESAEV